jgi:hypothetical protein
MLTALCKELRNWFVKSRYFGTFTIHNGQLNVTDMTADGSLQDGQFFRVVGSVFNDGVYQYRETVEPTEEHPQTFDPVLQDETFDGAIWCMAVPKGVIDLASVIEAWQENYGSVDSAAMSPFQSESFGGYSYNKGSAGTDDGAQSTPTWRNVFASEINRWRKI